MAKTDSEWLNLCSWVEKEIFGYDENQKLQKGAALRLKGLLTGQNVANNKCEKHGNYSCEVVLTTFKVNKDKILQAVATKDFTSEANKMAYVCAIIRNNINDVYARMNNAKKSEEKVKSANVDTIAHTGAEYVSKTEDKINKKLEEIW